MAPVLFILGLLAGAGAVLTFSQAVALPQQLAGLVIGVISAVLIAGGAVIDAIDKLRNAVTKATAKAETPNA